MSRRVAVIILAVAGITGALALYGMVDPESGFYPRCLFRQLTGLDCPGCGSQRALHALLHGRWAEAFGYNAFLFILMPVCLAMAVLSLLRHRFTRLYCIINSRAASLLILTLLVGWTIVRNLPIYNI